MSVSPARFDQDKMGANLNLETYRRPLSPGETAR
jgi:hypothetical protein